MRSPPRRVLIPITSEIAVDHPVTAVNAPEVGRRDRDDHCEPWFMNPGTFGPFADDPCGGMFADMSTTTNPVSILSEPECWDLVASRALGRLVTSVDGVPEIFPVNYVVQRRTILFRTAEGTKMVSAVINERVLFEVDDHDVAEGWSVIVKGVARVVRSDEDLAEAHRAQPPMDRHVQTALRSHQAGWRNR